MKTDTLDGLKDDELQAVIERAQLLLQQRDKDRKDKALEQARSILAGVGLSLRDIAKPHKNGGKGVPYAGGRQYQHPTNKSLRWNARGQKPKWLRELEAEGGRAIESESR